MREKLIIKSCSNSFISYLHNIASIYNIYIFQHILHSPTFCSSSLPRHICKHVAQFDAAF
jgi:hypothetical protein